MVKRPDSIRSMQWFQIFRQGGLILTAVAMANGLLSQQEIGNYELLLFLGFSLSFFWVDGLIKTYLMEYQMSEQKGKLVFQIYSILLAFSFALLIILVLGNQTLFHALLGQEHISYLGLYALYLFFILPSNLLSVHLMLKHMNRVLLALGSIMLIVPVSIVLISRGVFDSLDWMYRGFVLYGFVLHLVMLAIILPGWEARFDRSLIRSIIRLSWPLMIYAIAVSMARIFDGWLVSWFYQDESTFAIFRYGAREFPLAVALATGVTTAFIPILQKDLNIGLTDLKLRTARLIKVIFPIAALIILISPWAFGLVFTEDFVPSAFIFNIYLLLVLSQLLFPHAIVLSYKENQTILRASLVELTFNVILSLIFIQWWDLEGVALATVIAYFVEKIIYIQYLKIKYKIHSNQYVPWKIYFIFAVLIAISFLVSRFYIWA